MPHLLGPMKKEVKFPACVEGEALTAPALRSLKGSGRVAVRVSLTVQPFC
jgi:hypothetical protein